MVDIPRIRYRDIAHDEASQRERLAARLGQLKKIEENRKNLTSEERRELNRITEVLEVIKGDASELCEPLFVGVRDLFNASPGLLDGYLGNHHDGVLQGAQAGPGHGRFSEGASCKAALTIGLLMVDDAGAIAPVAIKKAVTDQAAIRGRTNAASTTPTKPEKRQIVAYTGGSGWASLSKMFFAAIGEAQSMSDLAMLVLPLLATEGDPKKRDGKPGTVDAEEFARVMRALVDKGVTADEPQLRRRINESLNVIQNRTPTDRAASSVSTCPTSRTPPNPASLDQCTGDRADDLCGAMFDELKVFEVVDKLVELFQHGMLTIGTGNAGKQLYKYWKDAPNRMSDGERRNFYSMTMGIPGGDASGMVNREFNDLWLRFVSSVSSFVRQNDVEQAAARATSRRRSVSSRCARRRATSPSTCRCMATAWPFTPRSTCRRRSSS